MLVQNQTVAGVPGRYASALFELARDAGEVERVERDLGDFDRLLDESADLRRLVRSPVFSADDQIRALGAILTQAGAGALASNFIKLTARNRRLFAIRDMIAAYRTLAAAARGEVTAEVISAQGLKPSQVEAIKAELKAVQGRDVKLTERVEPAILGGLIVRIGSRMIDNSLRTKLLNLKLAMKGIG